MAALLESRYRAGRYIVDLANRNLILDGRRVELPWRCFEALAILVEARGAIVDRDTLFRKLWPGIEVEETSLTKVLSQLRRALSAGDPATEYVETVPRLGYRLVVSAHAEGSTNGIAHAAVQAPLKPARSRLAKVSIALLVVAMAVPLGAWGWRHYRTIREAEDHYQLGRRLKRQPDSESIRRAIDSLRQATELNPRKAIYFTALAQALGQVQISEAMDFHASRQAAEQGVALDPACAGCQATLGFILFSRFWEWERAGKHLRESLRLDPGDVGIRGYLAMYLVSQARPGDALEQVDEAIRLAPFSARSHQLRAAALVLLRRYPEAVAATDRALSIDPNDRPTWDWRAHALLLAGKEKDALAAWMELGLKEHAADIDALHRRRGLSGALNRLLEVTDDWKSQAPNSYRRAQWSMYLNRPENALGELTRAVEFRHFNLIYAASDPVFTPIRARPEFQAILRQLGLQRGSM